MNIMSVESKSGRYTLLENWVGQLPRGYIEANINPEDFYAVEGFVIPTVEDGKVIAIVPNQKAKELWKSTQPEQIRADVDFIAAIQGVNL